MPSADDASQFSVEGSGRLCAVGYRGTYDNAEVAYVNVNDTSSSIFLIDGQIAQNISSRGIGDLNCTKAANLECMKGNSTQGHWIGCGFQLDISADDSAVVEFGGINCTSVSLAVHPGQGNIGPDGKGPWGDNATMASVTAQQMDMGVITSMATLPSSPGPTTSANPLARIASLASEADQEAAGGGFGGLLASSALLSSASM